MRTVGDLLSRDLSRKIEEIIQVDQVNEASVHAEVTEYVATESITHQYRKLLRAIAEAPSEAPEGVGIWVSGFFGSGKSSFAKNVGYLLQNPEILGSQFAELFKAQVDDHELGALVDAINTRIPTEAILFDVAKELDTRQVTQRVSEFIYGALLRHLDYADDFDIAELEIELEAEGRLQEFIDTCEGMYDRQWGMVRKGAQRIPRASAVLHALDPSTYPEAETWSRSQGERDAAVTVAKVVERTFELMARRRPGRAVVFVIDEVGQHVARSEDRIEDLRATIQEFGRVGSSKVRARAIPAPCWIVVTSQEKLDEVVAAIDSKRVQLAKLLDRFPHPVDLSPSDIREVATRRVLGKTDEAVRVLDQLFSRSQGALNAGFALERSSRRTDVDGDTFAQFYPYPPHYIDICIDIMSGIRLQPGAPRHLGGSNRTIIKQAYEMLVSERTAVGKRAVGALVTLDLVYELVEGNLSDEKRRDVHEIRERIDDDGTALRVAKVVCLLEFVRDVPRTGQNIATFLVDTVGDAPPVEVVEAALQRLHEAQFVRNAEDGWKLQTAQEKNWETERRSHDPRPRDRNEIIRASLLSIFSEPALRAHRDQDRRTFHTGISLNGSPIGDPGDISLALRVADDDDSLSDGLTQARVASRGEGGRDHAYWVFALTPQIDELVAALYASREMVKKYDQLSAQRNITPEEAVCLQDEKHAVLRCEARLQDTMSEELRRGSGMFQGVHHDASDLGTSLADAVRGLMDRVVPALYPKLEMGSRPLRGTEAEGCLKAADLSSLPPIFYDGPGGLALVAKNGPEYAPNPSADVARELRGYLAGHHEYGNREACQGKSIEAHFGRPPYGWERDMLRLVLAMLFRAGEIEVSFDGQKYSSYRDGRSRVPFVQNPKFRAAFFTPVKPIDLKTLTGAVKAYEELTGTTVDVEKQAIASAAREFATAEAGHILPVVERANANGMALGEAVAGYRSNIAAITNGTDEDCIEILTSEAASLRDGRDRIRNLAAALDEHGVDLIRRARIATTKMAGQLSRGGDGEALGLRKDLAELVESEAFFESTQEIESTTAVIARRYGELYERRHAERSEVYRDAIGRAKALSDWQRLAEPARQSVLAPLSGRACSCADRDEAGLVCVACEAAVDTIESHVEALPHLAADVFAKVQRLTAPPDTRVQQVRLADFVDGSLDTPDRVRAAVARLQTHLLDLVHQGVKIIVE
jgi:hypothetical protein